MSSKSNKDKAADKNANTAAETSTEETVHPEDKPDPRVNTLAGAKATAEKHSDEGKLKEAIIEEMIAVAKGQRVDVILALELTKKLIVLTSEK